MTETTTTPTTPADLDIKPDTRHAIDVYLGHATGADEGGRHSSPQRRGEARRCRMTDERFFQLLDAMPGAPTLVDGNRKYVHLGDVILEWTRVGKGDRWALSPSRDVVPATRPRDWWSRDVRTWVLRGLRINVAAYAQAMAARSL